MSGSSTGPGPSVLIRRRVASSSSSSSLSSWPGAFPRARFSAAASSVCGVGWGARRWMDKKIDSPKTKTGHMGKRSIDGRDAPWFWSTVSSTRFHARSLFCCTASRFTSFCARGAWLPERGVGDSNSVASHHIRSPTIYTLSRSTCCATKRSSTPGMSFTAFSADFSCRIVRLGGWGIGSGTAANKSKATEPNHPTPPSPHSRPTQSRLTHPHEGLGLERVLHLQRVPEQRRRVPLQRVHLARWLAGWLAGVGSVGVSVRMGVGMKDGGQFGW